jgi:urocanate hydratase
MTSDEFKKRVSEGIPSDLPALKPYDDDVNHAPKRSGIPDMEDKKLSIRNALRYFPVRFHGLLAPEFARELREYGRIYMYRFRPDYEIRARNIDDFPCRSVKAAAIMLMISNNLDKEVAQHPHELITYGGNGAVFQNWAQYLITMKYLSEMTDEQNSRVSGHDT